MEYRRLGKTEKKVSCIGLGGTSFFHRDFSVKPEDILFTSMDGGINIIDTARGYYESETLIGEALAGMKRRKEILIATKTWLRNYSAAKKEIETSLKNLKTDYIDLYQIHHIQYDYELKKVLSENGALRALKEAKREGKILHIGFTSHRPEMMLEAIKTGEFETIQLPMNPIEKKNMEPIVEEARKRDMGILAMKPFSGGVIRNVRAALKFALNLDMSTVLVGARTIEEIKADIDTAREFMNISEEEKEDILKEIENLDEKFCRRCRYCETVCKNNIPISDIFRSETYLLLSATYARNEYKSFAKHSTDCTKCGKCEMICPYKLPIREMLVTAHERLTRGKVEDFAVNILRKAGIYDIARKVYFKLGLPVPKR